jgi:hypothetical protein
LAGKPFAQAGDGLLERWLRAQGGAAQEPRFPNEPKSLLKTSLLAASSPP